MSATERHVWEILVPANWNTGAKIDAAYHQKWDARVREISGGLTIFRAVKGQWVYGAETMFEEVIPCRVLASRAEMDAIVAITLEHYHDQHSVLAYRLSSEILLKHRGIT